MKPNEFTLQAITMQWAMVQRSHRYAIPNNTIVLRWEADLLTFTRAYFIHEFECKLNLHDYKADFKKFGKHQDLSTRFLIKLPNYFWYATLAGFEIEPPEYAGWIVLLEDPKQPWRVKVRKEAPRLHKEKASEWQMDAVYRCMAHHLRHEYWDRLRRLGQVP
jgi:hypothetical protein